jgi:hypothetical protein
MSRLSQVFVAAFAVVSLAACSEVTSPTGPAVATARLSGSGGGGGGGGGGGATGGVRPCAILTFSIVNNAVLSTSVAPFWQANSYYAGQAVGSTEKSCDLVPGAVMSWTDITGTNDGCDLTVAQFVGATYVKYGLKPMSRYDQFFSYYTGANCIGTARTIQATLTDRTTGTVLSTMTTTWIVG